MGEDEGAAPAASGTTAEEAAQDGDAPTKEPPAAKLPGLAGDESSSEEIMDPGTPLPSEDEEEKAKPQAETTVAAADDAATEKGASGDDKGAEAEPSAAGGEAGATAPDASAA